MKWLSPFFMLLSACPAVAGDDKPDVILDEDRVRILDIESQEAAPETFEETIFALGRIEVLPGKRAVVSTRIAGRAHSVIGIEDMKVEAGDEMLWVESRQPGDPPPVIRVDAPISGILAKVNVARGQPVEPADTLMEIYDLEIVEAAAAVPEHLAGKLAKDLEARIRVPGFPEREWKAKLAHIGITADAASGTVEAGFHVANGDGALRPGMKTEFSIITGRREEVTAVPREAVQGDAGGRFVFIKHYELENAFWKRPVATGAENDKFIEITDGLNAGDEVVFRGAYALSFAGKGSVSLKEALDAAHGHPHNEDGSEMTKEQLAAAAAKGGGTHGQTGASGSLLWKIISGVLFALLVVSAVLTRKAGGVENKPPRAA